LKVSVPVGAQLQVALLHPEILGLATLLKYLSQDGSNVEVGRKLFSAGITVNETSYYISILGYIALMNKVSRPPKKIEIL
jgi:hypothetical protein